jgi:hypothetical protein
LLRHEPVNWFSTANGFHSRSSYVVKAQVGDGKDGDNDRRTGNSGSSRPGASPAADVEDFQGPLWRGNYQGFIGRRGFRTPALTAIEPTRAGEALDADRPDLPRQQARLIKTVESKSSFRFPFHN